jgi:hypothetical protein
VRVCVVVARRNSAFVSFVFTFFAASFAASAADVDVDVDVDVVDDVDEPLPFFDDDDADDDDDGDDDGADDDEVVVVASSSLFGLSMHRRRYCSLSNGYNSRRDRNELKSESSTRHTACAQSPCCVSIKI